ncbi:MAG: NusG domain II-containing protein [Elusimicrobiota bacterium]
MKKWDVILILFLLCSAGTLYLFRYFGSNADSNSLYVVVYEGNDEIMRTGLSEHKEFKVAENRMTIEIKDNKARVLDSSCAEQICVETGWIAKAGQSIVCVPNRVVVKIAGKDEGIDAVSY